MLFINGYIIRGVIFIMSQDILLYHFGGVYIDLDISWYQRLPDTVLNYHLILVKEDNYKIFGQLSNCLMGCTAKHPFMLKCFSQIQINSLKKYKSKFEQILNTSGPVMLTQVFINTQKNNIYLEWSTETDTKTLPFVDTKKRILVFPRQFYSNFKLNGSKNNYLIFYHHMDSSWCLEHGHESYSNRY